MSDIPGGLYESEGELVVARALPELTPLQELFATEAAKLGIICDEPELPLVQQLPPMYLETAAAVQGYYRAEDARDVLTEQVSEFQSQGLAAAEGRLMRLTRLDVTASAITATLFEVKKKREKPRLTREHAELVRALDVAVPASRRGERQIVLLSYDQVPEGSGALAHMEIIRDIVGGLGPWYRLDSLTVETSRFEDII